MPAKRGRRRKGEPPAYLLHRASGLAYVQIGGRERYLGEFGSADSKRRYAEFLRAWTDEHPTTARPRFVAQPGCTVAELVAAFSEHAQEHYRHADGGPTSEIRAFALSLRPLLGDAYADLPAAAFRPAHLKAIRAGWIRAGHARKTINQSAGRIRRLFKWAVGEELVPVDVALALRHVQDLGFGRTPAPDHAPVTPAPLRAVAAVLRHPDTQPAVAAMIRTQFYCGARPGEVCRMRVEEISRGGLVTIGSRRVQLPGAVWVFQPAQQKTQRAVYVIGERTQAALAPFLDQAMQAHAGYLFPGRRRGRPWTMSGYQHAIADACGAAGADHWSPGQLRHNFLSRLDAHAGIQLASYAVGHASVNTTAIYVEKNLRDVAEIISHLG